MSEAIDALSPRQREILGLLAKGYSNREIASAIGIAPGTVKIHVERLLRTLKVANRTEAAALAASDAIDTQTFYRRPAIAVLRFEADPADSVAHTLASGLADDLIALLCRWRWFPVIARSTSFFHGSDGLDHSAAELRARTGAAYLIGGSIARAGDRIHAVVRLDSDTHCLWTDRFDLAVDDIFELQHEVAALAVGRAYPEILAAEGRIARDAPPHIAAWQLAHAGFLLLDDRTQTTTERAIDLFQRAAADDPDFVLPLYGAGMGMFQQVSNQWTERVPEHCVEIERYARRAIALDEHDAAGWVLAGRAALTIGDAAAAIPPLERATHLNPSHATAHSLLGQAHILAGNQAGFESLRLAARLSPRAYASGLAFAYFAAADYAQVIATCYDALANRRTYVFGRALLCSARALAGDLPGARAELRLLRELHADFRIANIRHAIPAGRLDTADRFVEGLRLAGLDD